MSITPAPDPRVVARLREVLSSADFTVDAVFAMLGPDAHAALGRNETVPARRAASAAGPLGTLVRLFQLGDPVSRPAADRALPGLVDDLGHAGLLSTSGDEVRALVDVRPYGDEEHDWWVVCDLTPGLDAGPVHVDASHVLGISEASSSLARLTVRSPVASALDLGTGCGVQALHLAQHAARVVATDVNPRALALARLTGALNGVDLKVRDGSLYEPVAGERFDLIATNPPFVVSPPDGERLVYRETGFAGDDVVRRIVTGARDHLTPGGWCQVLGAWIHPADGSWQDRLAAWIAPTGLDAWVVQREEVDLAAYAEMWLADAGHRGRPGYTERYDAWLSWFAAEGVAAMGFGWISLRNAERATPVVRIESYEGPVAGPVGPDVLSWSAAADLLGDPAGPDVLDVRWQVAGDLVQHTWGPVGATDPAVVTIRLQEGLRRERQVDTVEAGLLSVCDGELTAGQALDALGVLLGEDGSGLRDRYRATVTELVAEGFLTAAGAASA